MKQRFAKKQIRLMNRMGKDALKALNAGVKQNQARAEKTHPGLAKRIDKIVSN